MSSYDASEPRIEPYPYPARAWVDDVLVAESDACLSLEKEGEPAMLYFPPGTVDPSRLPGGESDLLHVHLAPPDGIDQLQDWRAFDPAFGHVEVVDGRPADKARDITHKRFPTWGDAAHLIDMLNVRPDGDRTFISVTRSDGVRPVVEGSQMLAQAIVAGSRLVPEHRIISAQMVFLRGADARRPLRFELEERSRGRSFSTLSVQVFQEDSRAASGTLLLGVTAPDVVRHAIDAPDVAGPYESEPYDMGVTGRDIRVVDGAYTNDSDALPGPPVVDAWVRFRDVPADPALHAGLLAQFSGHMSIAAALRPHGGVGQDQAHRTLSMGINAINMSFHQAARVDKWLLYHHRSTFAGEGMTHADCRVHAEGGDLLASFSVDAMVRPFPAGTSTADARTAL